jgi:hypothetical protein
MSAFESGRGRRLELTLPRTDWPDLERPVIQYLQLQLERKATRSRIGHAGAEKEKRIAQHKRDVTKWLRSGKKGKEPVLTGVDKLDKEVEACTMRLESIEDALAEAEQELIDAVEEHRDEWAGDVDEKYRAALAEYAEVVEQLATARAKVSQIFSLLFWVQKFPEETHYRVRGSRVPALGAKMSGDLFTFEEVVEALREDTNPVVLAEPEYIPWGLAAHRMIAETSRG